jgi:hypothetical protein
MHMGLHCKSPEPLSLATYRRELLVFVLASLELHDCPGPRQLAVQQPAYTSARTHHVN